MYVCLSIAPSTMQEARSRLHQTLREADLVEVRLDGIRDLNLEQLLQKPRPKLIVTNRRCDEGGKFAGSAREQFGTLTQAMRLGAEYVDVEFSWGKEFISRLRSTNLKTRIICSYHNFEKTSSQLCSIYDKMRSLGPDVLKIATMANDASDAGIIQQIHRQARIDRQKLIAFCMGEAGQASRILSGIWGGFLTYAAALPVECTAPGQLTLDDLKKTFRVDTLNTRTKIFGLVGNPVKFSRGIYYHNERFEQRKANAVYVNFLINDLKRFIDSFCSITTGFSVTMPFKQQIIPLLDQVDGDAANLGVVNTVINRQGKLTGYNTDLPAIVSLTKQRTSLRRKHVVVLGTGATARTMTYAAVKNGAHTTVVGRSSEKASKLAEEFKCDWTSMEHLQSLRADILMNGTSVGMGNDNTRLVPKKYFRRGMIVFDAVANPQMTKLLRDAQTAGCKIITGAEFFQRQAHLQSKLFFDTLP